jgi:hypothetical protein
MNALLTPCGVCSSVIDVCDECGGCDAHCCDCRTYEVSFVGDIKAATPEEAIRRAMEAAAQSSLSEWRTRAIDDDGVSVCVRCGKGHECYACGAIHDTEEDNSNCNPDPSGNEYCDLLAVTR